MSSSPWIALVTGASRGIGRGIALALADAGATVYLTARTVEPDAAPLPGSLAETAAEVERRGGRARALACDHADDAQVRAVFETVAAESGRLDILANNVFAVPDGPEFFDTPFWEQPIAHWDLMHRVGLRSHYLASQLAVPLLRRSDVGLIATVSSFGGAGYQINVAYGVGKAATDRLASDMAHDLRPLGITSVSLWPGIVRTERLVAAGDAIPWSLDGAESPELTGRAIVALARDEQRLDRSGQVLVVAELAEAYGFTDVDGRVPRSLRRRGRAPSGADGTSPPPAPPEGGDDH